MSPNDLAKPSTHVVSDNGTHDDQIANLRRLLDVSDHDALVMGVNL